MSKSKEALRALLAELQAEKAAIEAQAEPTRLELEALNQEREALVKQIREKSKALRAITHPRIIELSEEISRVALALGARRMSDAAS